jgi:hypothetical protein
VVAMPHRTTHIDLFKRCRDLLARLTARLAALCAQSFAAKDAEARRYGWLVTSIRGGSGRRYWDPRFDRLVTCPACRGGGFTALGTPCRNCRGIGRIIVERVPDPPSGSPPEGSA